jgi:hypothetical protein
MYHLLREKWHMPILPKNPIKSTGTGSLEQDTTGNPGVKKTKIVYPKLAGAYPEIKKP